ncbi:MAG: PhzF family phenazine biosynthesis isomerase [Pseudomonadota bacterium]
MNNKNLTVPFTIIDAFSEGPFQGNPAAVCLLEAWLDDDTLQRMANQHQLSETAFIVKREKDFHLRWFTPTSEVKLCGHATLAAAYTLYRQVGIESIKFHTLSGELDVTVTEHNVVMTFPIIEPHCLEDSTSFTEGFDKTPQEAWLSSQDLLLVFNHESDIINLTPSLTFIKKLPYRGVICTAPSQKNTIDFISRYFAPAVGVDEDPVTGSAHCILASYWSQRLNQKKLQAYQASQRGGYVSCEVISNERILLSGKGRQYAEGKLYL